MNAAEPTRVAVVYDATSERWAAVMDLVEAQFSGREDLVFLERARIADLLKEQEISLSGVAAFEEALRVNAILKAHLLVVCMDASTATAPAVGLTIFDTERGVRLVDEVRPVRTLDEAEKELGRLVKLAEWKRRHLKAGVVTISLQSIRNADLDMKYDGPIGALGDLLERELVRASNVVVLERAYLGHLRHEDQLTLTDSTSLLVSAVYLDLEFSRADPGVCVIGLIRDSTGQVLHRLVLHGRLEQGLALLDEMARGVVEFLGAVSPGPVPDRAAEAKRVSQSDRKGALRALEAACVLDPDNPSYRYRLGREYIAAAAGAADIDFHQTVRKDGKIRTLQNNYPTKVKGSHPANADSVLRAYRRYEQGADLWLSALNSEAATGAGPLGQEEIPILLECMSQTEFRLDSVAPLCVPRKAWALRQAIKHRLHQPLVLGPHQTAWGSVSNAASFAVYSDWLARDLLPRLQRTASDSAEWSQAAMSIFEQWLELARRYGLDSIPTALNEVGRALLCPDKFGWNMERASIGYLNAVWWKLTASDVASWAPLYESLSRDPHPVLRFYGQAGFFRIRKWTEKNLDAGEECENLWREAMALMSTCSDSNRTIRYQAYHAVLNALMLLPGQPMLELTRRLYDYMTARHEFVYAVAWRASCFRAFWAKSSDEELLERADKVLAYLDTEGLTYLYEPERSGAVREAFLKQRDDWAARAGAAPSRPSLRSIMGGQVSYLFESPSYYNEHIKIEPPVVREDDAYFFVRYGWIADLEAAGTDVSALPRVVMDPDAEGHLFLAVKRISLGKMACDTPGLIRVDHATIEDVCGGDGRFYAALA
ncbi:MAG: hypothetical protein KKC51_09815, partial [Verrucomicrobia bacterium]|nr:hypothetical protein [Verrucomicrobiota bacterium]